MIKEERIKILYVDDEVNNLIGFKASLRVNYDVYIAKSAPEAYAHLEKYPDIKIIFCDQRMPEKTGVEFFEEIRNSFPDPVRILITGYTDIDSVIDAINRGHVFKYVKKPWNEADIISSIEEANKFYMVNSLLSRKNKELEVAYHELDKFAYSVTHDIRGPLLSILGVAELATELDDITEIKKMLGMMEKSVKKLDALILNIHDYYSVNQGELKLVNIDFNEIIKDQEDTHNVTINLNDINFETHVTQNERFRCDIVSLNVILTNLLSNAFKYQRKDREDKTVKLSVIVDKGVATISVKDNGIGIKENHLDKIFGIFYRATSENVGSGIGLYNVKNAMSKLNGEIKVDSVYGEGSTFKLILPSK